MWGSITIKTMGAHIIVFNICKFLYRLIECLLCLKFTHYDRIVIGISLYELYSALFFTKEFKLNEYMKFAN